MVFLSQTVRQSHSNQASMNQLQMHQPQLKQTEAFQPQPVVTSSTLEIGQLHCPIQLCPKNDHCSKSYTTLSNHVIWHRKLLDDPDHHVPETLLAKSVCRFCNTCRASVCPNPQTHQNLVVTDSMPFPSTLMRDTSRMEICQASMEFPKMPKTQRVIFRVLVESSSPKCCLKFVTKS